MITIEQYDSLLAYARKMTFNTNIDPYDVVHSAIALDENCKGPEVKTAFWKIRNAHKTLEFFETPKRWAKPKTKVCDRCKEDLSRAAFTYLSKGRYQNTCDRCICAHYAIWRANNLDAARKREREYCRLNKEKKNAASKQWYLDNVDAAKKRVKAWRANNPEKVKATKKKSDKKNRKKKRIYLQKWRLDNPDKVKGYQGQTQENRKNKRA